VADVALTTLVVLPQTTFVSLLTRVSGLAALGLPALAAAALIRLLLAGLAGLL
jgi:hypothetical protein